MVDDGSSFAFHYFLWYALLEACLVLSLAFVTYLPYWVDEVQLAHGVHLQGCDRYRIRWVVSAEHLSRSNWVKPVARRLTGFG